MAQSRLMFVTLVDDDSARRDAVTEAVRRWARHVEQLDHVRDLMRLWPLTGILLVNDNGRTAEELHRAMAGRGLWRAHVFYSETLSPTRVTDAVMGGAMDYLAWPFNHEVVGQRLPLWRERAAARTTRELRRARAKKRIETLTRRERQVLNLVVQGLTDREIGERLGIDTRTSQVHRGNMLAKLGTNRSTAAVRMAMDAGLDRTRRPHALRKTARAETEQPSEHGKVEPPSAPVSPPIRADKEIWKAIGGSDPYEVSDAGRIRFRETGELKEPTQRSGELVVNLYANRKSNVRQVKSVVAESFLRSRAPNEIVTHNDGDRLNCAANNLVICPRSGIWPLEGHARASFAGRKLTTVMVSEIKRRLHSGEPLASLAAEFGVSVPHVCNIKNGRKWTASARKGRR